MSYEGNLRGTYTYNGRSQLAIRTISNMGTGIDGTIHTVHDLWGNVIAEADATGQTVREYLWIPEVGHAGVSLPIAGVDNVDTTTPATYYVHTDHLSRPILMTDGAKATVWQAEWSPWGAPLSITASPEMNQRFPGQWYQLEAGLHYNWHRHYDPSLGRYTQPDPLGFVDGPSVFAYARNDPQMYVDPDGRFVPVILGIAGGLLIDLALNEYCGCETTVGGAAASAASGAAIADAIAPEPKRSRRIKGASPYLSRATKLFTTVTGGAKLPLRLPAPTLRNPSAMSRSLARSIHRDA